MMTSATTRLYTDPEDTNYMEDDVTALNACRVLGVLTMLVCTHTHTHRHRYRHIYSHLHV